MLALKRTDWSFQILFLCQNSASWPSWLLGLICPLLNFEFFASFHPDGRVGGLVMVSMTAVLLICQPVRSELSNHPVHLLDLLMKLARERILICISSPGPPSGPHGRRRRSLEIVNIVNLILS